MASGPLTSDKLFEDISKKTGDRLFFFDAVAPIVDAQSIDYDFAFESGRYGKGDGYINCPMNKEEYDAFYNALISGETVPLKDFEGSEVFEGCMWAPSPALIIGTGETSDAYCAAPSI